MTGSWPTQDDVAAMACRCRQDPAFARRVRGWAADWARKGADDLARGRRWRVRTESEALGTGGSVAIMTVLAASVDAAAPWWVAGLNVCGAAAALVLLLGLRARRAAARDLDRIAESRLRVAAKLVACADGRPS